MVGYLGACAVPALQPPREALELPLQLSSADPRKDWPHGTQEASRIPFAHQGHPRAGVRLEATKVADLLKGRNRRRAASAEIPCP